MKRRWVLPFVIVTAACGEQFTAPGACPNFCPGGAIDIQDTIFAAIISRDSSYRGYLPNYQAEAMTATDLPGVVDSRAFVRFDTMSTIVRPRVGDTTSVPINVDSVRLRLTIMRRDKQATNLRLKLYHLPVTVDSTSDFASLDPYFTASVVDSLNVNDLLARPAIGDTATVRIWGDSIRVDSAGHVLQISRVDSSLSVYFNLDTTQAPLVAADSGRLAYGVRVAADSFASVSLGTSESATGPELTWFYHYRDSVATKPDSVVATDRLVLPRFDSFVFSPPSPPLDSNLTVGGVPSARSLVRIAWPKYLHDSIDVVRATLVLLPVSAVQGVPSDSFNILARPIVADFGAKSPLSTTSTLFASTYVHIGSTDTVRIELTNLARAWTSDTTLTTAVVLGQVPEATSYTEAHFYSSRAPAFRPTLHVTYVHRFQFGKP